MKRLLAIVISLVVVVITVLCVVPFSVKNQFTPHKEVYLAFLKNRGTSPEIERLAKCERFDYFARPSMCSWKEEDGLFYGKIPDAAHAVDLVFFGKGADKDIGVIGIYTFPVDKDLQPLRGYLSTVSQTVDCKYHPDWGYRFSLRVHNMSHSDYVKLCSALVDNTDLTHWRDLFLERSSGYEFPRAEHAALARVFFGWHTTLLHRI